jgi:hypothetical protein
VINQPDDGYVYFAAPAHDIVAIKIGWSTNPAVVVHENGNRWTWYDLKILALIRCQHGQICGTGQCSLEKRLHRAFAVDRIKREWFLPTDRLLELVDRARNGLTPAQAIAWIERRDAA